MAFLATALRVAHQTVGVARSGDDLFMGPQKTRLVIGRPDKADVRMANLAIVGRLDAVVTAGAGLHRRQDPRICIFFFIDVAVTRFARDLEVRDVLLVIEDQFTFGIGENRIRFFGLDVAHGTLGRFLIMAFVTLGHLAEVVIRGKCTRFYGRVTFRAFRAFGGVEFMAVFDQPRSVFLFVNVCIPAAEFIAGNGGRHRQFTGTGAGRPPDR